MAATITHLGVVAFIARVKRALAIILFSAGFISWMTILAKAQTMGWMVAAACLASICGLATVGCAAVWLDERVGP